MNRHESLAFKLSLAKSALKTCFVTNALANGICFYFLSHGEGRAMADFGFNAMATAFILSLICFPCAQLMANGMDKRGELDAHTYDRDDHLLIHFFPKGRLAQTLIAAILITIVFGPLESGIAVIAGFAAGNLVPLVPGTIIHGVCAGLMGLANMYLGYVGRFTTLRAEKQAIEPVAEY